MRPLFRSPCSLVVAGALLASCFPGAALAQGDDWKELNDRGNRYEGRIEIPVGRPDLELLSFVGFLEPFEGTVTLGVRFFLPRSFPVFIHGRELQERAHYWMESKESDWRAEEWNEFGPWPTGDVLARDGIPPSNLGVAVRLRTETAGSGELAPAFLYHTSLPETVDRYTLFLRPNAKLKEVHYSLFRLVDQEQVEVASEVLYGEKVPGVPFPLELDVEGQPEGPMRLVVTGKFKNKLGGPVREYDFYHKPRIEQPDRESRVAQNG